MRLKLTLAYVGTAYAGWQRQPRVTTVQGVVEDAAARIAGRHIGVAGAGRTDAGVHAAGQTAHFDSGGLLDPSTWLSALNALLPADVRVVRCEPAPADFHARFDARRKVYRYSIDEAPVASPFLAPFAWHLPKPLDLEAMRDAANRLVGPVDQRAFATRSDKPVTVRPIDAVTVERDRLLTITVVGRSFLRCVVRGIAGTLVQVGRGRRDGATLGELARSGDRDAAGPTAPAHGLCLVRIDYRSDLAAGSDATQRVHSADADHDR